MFIPPRSSCVARMLLSTSSHRGNTASLSPSLTARCFPKERCSRITSLSAYVGSNCYSCSEVGRNKDACGVQARDKITACGSLSCLVVCLGQHGFQLHFPVFVGLVVRAATLLLAVFA